MCDQRTVSNLGILKQEATRIINSVFFFLLGVSDCSKAVCSFTESVARHAVLPMTMIFVSAKDVAITESSCM